MRSRSLGGLRDERDDRPARGPRNDRERERDNAIQGFARRDMKRRRKEERENKWKNSRDKKNDRRQHDED